MTLFFDFFFYYNLKSVCPEVGVVPYFKSFLGFLTPKATRVYKSDKIENK